MPAAKSASRGRRAPRVSGEDRERAILATAETLLAEHDLDGFSVDDLARGAGLSRPTFYFYFASKEAVVLTLLDRVIDEANRMPLPLDFPGDPVGSWRRVIQNIVDVFSAHRVVTAAAVRASASSPELRTLWSSAMENWVAQCTDVITAERARGAAPAGLPARDLAVALNLMNERVLAASFTSEQPSVDEGSVTDVLRGRFDELLDEYRAMLRGSLDGLTDEQARRRLVPSKTTPLGLVKHVTYVEGVWFDQAVTGRTTTQIGIASTPDRSFTLRASDTVESVQNAHDLRCAESRRTMAPLSLDAVVDGRGERTVWALYVQVLRELAQHAGHADILREQILAQGAVSPP